MFRASNLPEKIFSSQEGDRIYNRILDTVNKENMAEHIDRGVLLGVSGGADSVLLACFFVEYKRRTGKSFSLLAVHVNHSIRGQEADDDERFSGSFCHSLGIDFQSVKIDVPAVSSKLGIGLEEAARNTRYSVFSDIIKGRNDILTISVAHNSTDNIETVIMNMLRGSGLSGLCGIKPVRDNVIRPLITVSKSEIIELLDSCGVQYVTDSTNLSSAYSRNYVRNEILPLFARLSQNPENQITRMTESLRSDLDYINSQARVFLNECCMDSISTSDLNKLHPALQARVLTLLIFENTGLYPEEKHISSIRELLGKDNFSYSLPGDKDFVSQRGKCSFVSKIDDNNFDGVIFSLAKGENKIYGTNLTVFIGDIDKSSSNVYNFSIQAKLSSDIIDEGLTLRFKSDGDSYRYCGMTHKLKKVFNDRNIPPMERKYIPVLCDSQGIVYVPGLSERDGAKCDDPSKNISVTFAYRAPKDGEKEVFTSLLRK